MQIKSDKELNRLISESLNEKILEKMYYDNWDGKLPTVMGGDGTMSLVEIPTK